MSVIFVFFFFNESSTTSILFLLNFPGVVTLQALALAPIVVTKHFPPRCAGLAIGRLLYWVPRGPHECEQALHADHVPGTQSFFWHLRSSGMKLRHDCPQNCLSTILAPIIGHFRCVLESLLVYDICKGWFQNTFHSSFQLRWKELQTLSFIIQVTFFKFHAL